MIRGTKPKRIVILGAGFGGTYTFKHLHRFFHRDLTAQLILVNRHNYFLFTPLLHEVATGGVSPENITESLRKVIGCCLYDFYLATVESINLDKKEVITTLGPISYDYLVISLGAETNFYDVIGAKDYSFTLKSLEDAIRLKNHFITTLERSSKVKDESGLSKLLTFVVVGGGPTGVELAAEMADFLYGTFAKFYSQELISKVRIILLQSGPELLPAFPPYFRQKSLEVLKRKEVEVRLNTSVVRVGKDSIVLSSGEELSTSGTIWVAGIQPASLRFQPEPEKDNRGRLIVDQTLQLKGYPDVFVLGDLACFKDEKTDRCLPALAQVATKQAKVVAENIKCLVRGRPCQPFTYHHSGDLVSLGRWLAVGEISKFSFSGHFAWWLWRTVYLSKLISWPKKIKVAVDWTLNLFMPRDISQL
jgi:NADH dehydrogenase